MITSFRVFFFFSIFSALLLAAQELRIDSWNVVMKISAVTPEQSRWPQNAVNLKRVRSGQQALGGW